MAEDVPKLGRLGVDVNVEISDSIVNPDVRRLGMIVGWDGLDKISVEDVGMLGDVSRGELKG